MVARIDPCNPEALRLLLNDRLPPALVGGLEAHLEGCLHCRRALDQMAGGAPWSSAVRNYLGGTADAELGSETPDDGLDFLSPSADPESLGTLGSYEIRGVLGRGGNGIVLKAFDGGLNRFVAVKVIASVLAGSGAARKRFAREAQAAAAVVHEHVIAVHAVHEEAGLPYLVMEYVPGRSLQDRLDKEGPLELREILRIGMQTAAGLAAAHAQGLVHRDIKPANILLENGVERVKITDFGLARAVADASLTQSGVITGTPNYMAPEQARGDAVDHRADLFSLGSTLYATCTGHPPFRADTPLAVLRRVTDETPRPVRETNPDIPAWLGTILDRLLAKDPSARFQTAAEVADLFERCLAHVQQPLAVALPKALDVKGHGRPRQWLRWSPIVAGLMVVSVGIALGLGSRNGTRTRDPDETARGFLKASQKTEPATAAVSTERFPEEVKKADAIDEELAETWKFAAGVEQSLTMSSSHARWVVPDEIEREIVRVAERVHALEQELTLIRRSK